MIMDTIQCDLIAPETTFFSGPAAQIDIPGVEGDFGVLPGHMKLISAVRMGVIHIHTGKEAAKRIFVASAIAEVKADACTILAEHVTDLDNVTRSDAEKSLSEARTALDNALDDAAKTDAIHRVEVAEALISALS